MKALVLAILVIIMVLIGIQFLPDTTTAFHDTVTDTYTTTGNVTTGAGVTTSEVTLDQALYNDNLGWVTSLTSSYGGDAPRASSYASGNQSLALAGLTESQNRLITVVYDYDNTGDYAGLEPASRMGPTLILMILAIGLPLALLMRMFWDRIGG